MASLFVGAYTQKMAHCPNAKGEGIYVYNVTSSEGGSIALARVHTIPNVVNPSFLEITTSKRYLYAVTESLSLDKSLIHAFQIPNRETNPAEYRYIDSWPIGGIGACHVRIDDRDQFVFSSNYNGGNITAFKIDQETGRLEKRNFHQFTEFSNVNKERQEAPHLHASIIDARMRFVYFVDLGNDCIWRMNYSDEKGFDVESKRRFPAPPGSGPRHLVFRPNGQHFLYVSCELTNHILVYKVKDDGDLEQLQYEPTTTNVSYTGPKGAADIHSSADGRFVYVSTRFLNIISVFQIQNDGKVKLTQEIGSGGQIPRSFVLYSPLNLLLVANQDTNDVTVFARDGDSGQLSQIQKVEANTPVCLKILG